ncbi:hypothetical protein ACIQZO_26945 [Streptomyces sp. NPDC097617]|uniref:hypothetical protein n=1 Tax=Streptomyces sp. NPDC097617 TaxID=3366091 RepID=UPI0038221F12
MTPTDDRQFPPALAAAMAVPPGLAAIAERFAPHRRRSATAVIDLAAQAFPDFDDTLMKLCR